MCEVYGDEYENGLKKRFGHVEEFKKIANKLVGMYQFLRCDESTFIQRSIIPHREIIKSVLVEKNEIKINDFVKNLMIEKKVLELYQNDEQITRVSGF